MQIKEKALKIFSMVRALAIIYWPKTSQKNNTKKCYGFPIIGKNVYAFAGVGLGASKSVYHVLYFYMLCLSFFLFSQN